MNSKQREEIVRAHGPHISHKHVPASTLNRVNIKHLVAPTKNSPNTELEGCASSSTDDSGPPSPCTGQLLNFGIVSTGIYRSAFPWATNLEHIKSLRLKTIVTLVKTTFDFATLDFLKESGIKHYRIPIPAHKDGQKIAMMDIAQIMRILTNPCNQPMLVHCNKGKHRTGCIIAAFRRLAIHNDRTDWAPLDNAISEYLTFSNPKPREADMTFINAFSPRELIHALADIIVPVKPINYARLPPPITEHEKLDLGTRRALFALPTPPISKSITPDSIEAEFEKEKWDKIRRGERINYAEQELMREKAQARLDAVYDAFDEYDECVCRDGLDCKYCDRMEIRASWADYL